MIKAYHICQWDAANETAESRKIKVLTWYAKQNKLDGLGIARLRSHPQRVELLAAWTLMETLASKAWPQAQRGWLLRNGQALTTADMAFLTSFPEEIFKRAVDFFSSEEMGWLEYADVPAFILRGAEAPPTSDPAPGQSAGIKRKEFKAITAPAESQLQTDTMTTTQTNNVENKNKGAALNGAVAASRTQWAALNKRVKELEALGNSLTPEQRQELRIARGHLLEVERKQSAGNFGP